ncbi:MAG: carboxy-S-adenosyl-L-methionine synthase CmoA [Ignavibacteriaceae bacterium]
MNKDEVFKKPIDKIDDFNFGENVAQVFDDMLSRSVPFYDEMQRMMTEIAKDFAIEGTNVYDLGCSTGTTLLNLNKVLSDNIKFVGIDYSKDMIDKCEANFKAANVSREYQLMEVDLNKGIILENPSVVVMCLTLQFVRPLYRETIISEIFKQLNHGGCLILIEKVLGEDSLFNRLFIKYYYDFKKRNHYSDMEISQKREALENVLVPYKLNENLELLAVSGFRYREVFFKWYNFTGIVAIK